jgi:hypothetical protein
MRSFADLSNLSKNMAVPAMRVIVDGDSSKVYRKGDTVTGRVILVVEEEVKIQSLKMVFAGNCVTKTSRPFHVNGAENSPSRREFEEKIRPTRFCPRSEEVYLDIRIHFPGVDNAFLCAGYSWSQLSEGPAPAATYVPTQDRCTQRRCSNIILCSGKVDIRRIKRGEAV